MSNIEPKNVDGIFELSKIVKSLKRARLLLENHLNAKELQEHDDCIAIIDAVVDEGAKTLDPNSEDLQILMATALDPNAKNPFSPRK